MKTITKPTKKSWREKLEDKKPGYPKIVNVPERWARKTGKGTMLVPTALLIDEYIRRIPKGKLITVNGIREKAAGDFNAGMACPLTTGIFIWISAGAAEEDREKGKKNITPYWRVLKEGGKLNPKFPGGVRNQAKLLEAEGFKILRAEKDALWKVSNFEKHIVKL